MPATPRGRLRKKKERTSPVMEAKKKRGRPHAKGAPRENEVDKKADAGGGGGGKQRTASSPPSPSDDATREGEGEGPSPPTSSSSGPAPSTAGLAKRNGEGEAAKSTTTANNDDAASSKEEIMTTISNDLKEMVDQERSKLVKLRGELLGIPNPLGYQRFREEEAVKEEIIDALQAIYEAKDFSEHSLETVLTTLKDDYESAGKEIVSKALSRRRARKKAISAIENELRRERKRHARRQLKLVVAVAAFTYLVNKMHRDARFRERVGSGLRNVYALWTTRVVPGCRAGLGWLNRRRRAVQRALGPEGALPSRNSSHAQLADESKATGKRKAKAAGSGEGSEARGERTPSPRPKDQGGASRRETPVRSPLSLDKFLDRIEAEAVEQQQDEEERVANESGGSSRGLDGDDDPEVFFSKLGDSSSVGKQREPSVPSAFYCPITMTIMSDPVIAADGHTYEREAIKTWLREHKTSPRTNLELRHTHVIPNHSLKSAIQEFQSSQDTRGAA